MARGAKRLYRRWRAAPEILSDTLWTRALRTSAYAQTLPKPEQKRLRRLTHELLRVKSFEGAGDFRVTAAMRARVALHAALPILNLDLDYYADWTSVVLYPGDFRAPEEYMDEAGVVHHGLSELCGQSLDLGPIVLSWEALRVEDAAPSDHDLVIHECAHKLDLLNGAANGFPPLHAGMRAQAWAEDFRDAYEHLCDAIDAGESTVIDPYAAEDPAEFFAVVSETFFTDPQAVRGAAPAVYDHLRRFYRQDPARALAA